MAEHEPQDVEMVAKTLHAHTGRSARDFPWGYIDEVSRNYYRENARRLLTRLDEARAARTIRHEDDEFAPGECDGSGTCSAPIHVHGCYTPHRSDQCDSPEEYGHADSTDGSER